jgi:hypothetical protein
MENGDLIQCATPVPGVLVDFLLTKAPPFIFDFQLQGSFIFIA